MAVLALGLLASATPALAHRSSVGSTAGIPIPSLTHGQMAVIADNRSAILDLVAQQVFEDATFVRLRNYYDLQSLACFWGLVPGSISDEASPFNECSHAYLSAARALLLHLRDMRGDRTAARALIDKIDLQMIANHTSLVLCRYSDEPFNTADVILPHWSDIPFHGPSLFSLLGAGLMALCGGILGWRFLVSPRPHPHDAADGANA
jgi:hypothetical protein